MTVKVYVEGGGDQAPLKRKCREGFAKFFGKTALARFYGNGFRAPALPADPVIEEIPKQDVLDGLNNAARGCTKAKYDKGRHSFDLLGIVDPELVTKASPHAHRLLEALIENT